ncbi:MAG: hypothetical protein ACFFD4_25930 [Candidatus Odinarchaeota archaeon]
MDEAFAFKCRSWDITDLIHRIAKVKFQVLELSEAKKTVMKLVQQQSEQPASWAIIDGHGTVLHTSRSASEARNWLLKFQRKDCHWLFFPYSSNQALRALMLATKALTGTLGLDGECSSVIDLCKATAAALTCDLNPRVVERTNDLFKVRKREIARLRQLMSRKGKGSMKPNNHYHSVRISVLSIIPLSDPFIVQTARSSSNCETCNLSLVDCRCDTEEQGRKIELIEVAGQ